MLPSPAEIFQMVPKTACRGDGPRPIGNWDALRTVSEQLLIGQELEIQTADTAWYAELCRVAASDTVRIRYSGYHSTVCTWSYRSYQITCESARLV